MAEEGPVGAGASEPAAASIMACQHSQAHVAVPW